MKWTDIPLDRPVAVCMLLLTLMVVGVVAIGEMPIGFIPVIKEPSIDVAVPFPGSQPLEGLREVGQPIEAELARIPDIKNIWVNANSGFVSLEAGFDWGVDVDLKKMEVRDAVDRIRGELPRGIGQIGVEGDTDGGDGEVLGGRISANHDLSESWALLDRKIRRPLERVRGVQRVDLYGVEPQQVRIDLDLESIQRHGVPVGDVIARIEEANLDLDAGVIRSGPLRYEVRTLGRFGSVDDLARLEVGQGLRLRDVAAVALREPELTYGRHLNRNFAIGFDVFKEPTANTVATVSRLHARLDEIRRDPQLNGIDVLVWQDQAEMILNSIQGLRNAGAFGGLLAVVVLYFFLRRATTTLIVAVAIPFSLLVTCAVMFLIGMEFNVLTMMGLMLGVGMLVDNAVVVIENIYRLQTQGMPASQAARLGPRQVGNAVLAATATTLIVWSWLFISEQNNMTIMIGQVAGVICIAVACSLLVSLTFIPFAAGRLAPRKGLSPGFMANRFVPAYRTLLGWTLRYRLLALILLFALSASAAIPFNMVEKHGDVEEQQTDVVINYRIYDPSTKDVLEGYVNQVEDWIEARRESLGYTDLYSWFEEPNRANTRVYLDRSASRGEWQRLTAMLRDDLPTIAGVELEIGDNNGRQNRRDDSITDVSVALHGDDPEFLQELALEVEDRFRKLEDVREVYGPSLVGERELRLRVHSERARQFALSPGSVAEAVQFAFRGQHLRRFEAPSGEIEMILGLPETAKPGVAALADLRIPNSDGVDVRLGDVAQIERTRTPSRIQRSNRRTTSWVTAQFDGDVTVDDGRKRVTAIMERQSFPENYGWAWSEWHRDDDEALAFMARGVGLSLLIVLLLMAGLFESFTQPLAILITLPLGMVGAFWSLWLFGFNFEMLAFIGLIILIGVVVNNGIVLVDHVNSLRRDGRDRQSALLEGCGDRLRPVLMTVITTVVGLIPLATSEFTVAGVQIQSMAVVMMGGLVSSTVFTLVGLPVWYTWVEDLGAFLAGAMPFRGGSWLPFGIGRRLPTEERTPTTS